MALGIGKKINNTINTVSFIPNDKTRNTLKRISDVKTSTETTMRGKFILDTDTIKKETRLRLKAGMIKPRI